MSFFWLCFRKSLVAVGGKKTDGVVLFELPRAPGPMTIVIFEGRDDIFTH